MVSNASAFSRLTYKIPGARKFAILPESGISRIDRVKFPVSIYKVGKSRKTPDTNFCAHKHMYKHAHHTHRHMHLTYIERHIYTHVHKHTHKSDDENCKRVNCLNPPTPTLLSLSQAFTRESGWPAVESHRFILLSARIILCYLIFLYHFLFYP